MVSDVGGQGSVLPFTNKRASETGMCGLIAKVLLTLSPTRELDNKIVPNIKSSCIPKESVLY